MTNSLRRHSFLKGTGGMLALTPLVPPTSARQPSESPTATAPSTDRVRGVDFHSQLVYRSPQQPGYACWVSFFPGEKGKWYITCEEVTKPEKPYPKMTFEQARAYRLPTGMDKAHLQMTIVMLESTDHLNSWKVISRQPVRFQQSAGSFGQARTPDGADGLLLGAVSALLGTDL